MVTAGLTTTERAALVLLGSLGRQTGLQLVAASSGMLELRTVYVALAALINRGWVDGQMFDGLRRLPAVRYGLTPVGRLELELLHEAWGRSAA